MNHELDLNAKLEAYETNVSGERSRLGTDGSSKWSYYVAAAASGLAMTTAAEAQIFYSGIQDVTASGNGYHRATIDIDGNGNKFLLRELFLATVSTIGRVRIAASAAGAEVMINNGILLANRLASGSKISDGAGFFSRRDQMLDSKWKTSSGHVFQRGYWARNQAGFAGVKFKEGTDTHFGWIRLKWDGNGDGFPTSVTAID